MYNSSSPVTIILMALQCSHHIKHTLLYAKYDDIYMMILYSIKGSSAWRRLPYTNRTSLLLCIFHLIQCWDCLTTHVENTRSLIRTRCDGLWCSWFACAQNISHAGPFRLHQSVPKRAADHVRAVLSPVTCLCSL